MNAPTKLATMKALVYNGRGQKAFEDHAKPEVDEPGDAIVRITKTTICGTDLHILKGDLPSCVPGGFSATKASALSSESARR